MKGKILSIVTLCIMCYYFIGISKEVYASSLNNNPNITFSPDGEAFTTDAGEQDYKRYGNGYTVTTAITSSRRSLKEGEHLYGVPRTGIIPIGKWVVQYDPGHCTHNSYPNKLAQTWHGVSFNRHNCFNYYKSGWIGYCADCGGGLPIFIYMDEQTAKSLTNLPTIDYYYKCPTCDNLEQGRGISHTCQSISWNRYYIKYDENSRNAFGIMPNSTHMYNNEILHDGEEIIPETKLRKCVFYREGYEFIGWSTSPTGEVIYEDEQEILNLSNEEEGTVILYAKWKKSNSTLHIDPAGGSYERESGITSLTNGYGFALDVSADKIEAPTGNRIRFVTNGGTAVEEIYTTKYFKNWQQTFPFNGKLEEGIYTYRGLDGTEDTITAYYGTYPITLSGTTKKGYSFGGWFRDSEFTTPVGTEGDKVLLEEDTVLYALWVDLQLISTDNYTANGGGGAVDLSWNQQDNVDKTYKLYQSTDLKNWSLISTQGNTGTFSNVQETFLATKKVEQYVAPFSGFYTLTAIGAQGESYGNYAGGLGGSITASIWLSKGEQISYNIGTQAGYNCGGIGSSYGNGGGMTSVSSALKQPLLIAGGGGGASNQYPGGEGGSTASNTKTSYGGSLGVGGGGGYQGGTGGEVVMHYHTAVCRHAHTGNQNTYGGCYTRTSTILCGTTSTSYIGWWSNDGDEYCDQCWPLRVTRAEHPQNSHSSTTCRTCGAGCSGTYHYKAGYVLNCGLDVNQLFCEYQRLAEPGGIVSAYPSYGGSNYVNTTYCILKEDQAGIGMGDGSLYINMTAVEYIDSLSLKEVRATDLAAPEKIDEETVNKVALGENTIKVLWSQPKDQGTIYYHKAESYSTITAHKIGDSNITINTLTSGIKGYCYIVDTSSKTKVTAQDKFILANAVMLELTEDVQYLHVAALDFAGNISESIHIQIGKNDVSIAWLLHTSQIQITSEQDSVYMDGNKCYVKADGKTPFTLTYKGTMEHDASKTYMINYSMFDITDMREGKNQRYNIYTPTKDKGMEEIVSEIGELSISMAGEAVLNDAAYSKTIRKNKCRDLDIIQKFYLDAEFDEANIEIVPVVGAVFNDSMVCSKWEEDITHGISIIGDGKAPEIYGVEAISSFATKQNVSDIAPIELTCIDMGSGVERFWVEILNTDNYSKMIIEEEEEHRITLKFAEDEIIFKGAFTITVYAKDHVGNLATETYVMAGLSLEARITRILEPHDPIFKGGESGILEVTVIGYAEKIEIFFPEELTRLNPSLNQCIILEEKKYTQTQEIKFTIPLYTPEADYVIKVKAFKGSLGAEAKPEFCMFSVTGNVLKELRTRLR